VEEWNDFWKGRQTEWGSGKLRKVVSSLVYEADVDVSDLVNKNVERTTDLHAKHEIAQVVEHKTAELVGTLFALVDSNANGRVTKKEVAMSVLGESMTPYWGRLDGDADGSVSSSEFLSFFRLVQASCKPSQFQGWVSNMVHEAKVDVSGLVSATMKEQAEAKAALEAKQKAKAKADADKQAQKLLAAGVLKQGELDIQQGRFWYSWHSYTFQLTASGLSMIFKQGSRTTTMGHIPIGNILGISSAAHVEDNCFVIASDNDESWNLRASSDEDERAWKMVLIEAQMIHFNAPYALANPNLSAKPAPALTDPKLPATAPQPNRRGVAKKGTKKPNNDLSDDILFGTAAEGEIK